MGSAGEACFDGLAQRASIHGQSREAREHGFHDAPHVLRTRRAGFRDRGVDGQLDRGGIRLGRQVPLEEIDFGLFAVGQIRSTRPG